MDTVAYSHVTGDTGTLSTTHSLLAHDTRHIVVGNAARLPVLATAIVRLSSRPFYLQQVLLSPNIVQKSHIRSQVYT